MTGWETSAVAAAFGAEPIPASLEYRPRLMPCIIAEPRKPPKIALKSKALLKMLAKTLGMLPMLMQITISETMM